MFDDLPRRSGAPKNAKKDGLLSEFDAYIKTETEETDDAILWWYERRKTYPALARMALDYLCIPGTSMPIAGLNGRLLTLGMRPRACCSNVRRCRAHL